MPTRFLALYTALALCTGASMANSQGVTNPEMFVNAATSSNMFEIESSQLALTLDVSDPVRAFAQHMVDEHTQAGVKMKEAAIKDAITPPASMSDKDQSLLGDLQAAKGEAFESVYLAEQVTAHDEAVALFESFSQGGPDNALRAFAVETLPILKQHQTAVKALVASR
jgi:putative membrane protein